MQIVVTSKTLPVTQAIRQAALRQAAKLSRLGERVVKIGISFETIAKKKHNLEGNIVQYHVELPGRHIVVKRHVENIYHGLVEVAGRAAEQMTRFKQRRLELHRRQAHKPVRWSEWGVELGAKPSF